jgi:hypothetical protein
MNNSQLPGLFISTSPRQLCGDKSLSRSFRRYLRITLDDGGAAEAIIFSLYTKGLNLGHAMGRCATSRETIVGRKDRRWSALDFSGKNLRTLRSCEHGKSRRGNRVVAGLCWLLPPHVAVVLYIDKEMSRNESRESSHVSPNTLTLSSVTFSPSSPSSAYDVLLIPFILALQLYLIN